jgi:hypothetical protein
VLLRHVVVVVVVVVAVRENFAMCERFASLAMSLAKVFLVIASVGGRVSSSRVDISHILNIAL